MSYFAAVDVSQEQTAICVVDEQGAILAEGKVSTCADAIVAWLERKNFTLDKLGMETGPLAAWLWNELKARGQPIICIDARHANAALKMMPNKTDRNDAIGLAQIIRTGWYKEARIKSHSAYVIRSLLKARDVLVGMRVRLENEIRGLLKTFGVMFGKRVGGFMRRAEEIITKELDVVPELRSVFEALVAARRDVLLHIKTLDSKVRIVARQNRVARLLATAPGVGPVTSLAITAAFDDASRFRRSSSAGAYLGLTPKRYESGEVSRNGRISKCGDRMTRTYLYEAANALMTRKIGGAGLRQWALALAKKTGPRKPRSPWRVSSPSSCMPCGGAGSPSKTASRSEKTWQQASA